MTGLDNPVATGGSALFVALAIQALKNSGWATWFNRNTSRANLVLSIIAAYATQLGIHYTYDVQHGTLVITGLTLAAITHAAYQTAIQWATQHGWYKVAIVPAETLGEIRAILQRSLPPPISASEQKSEDAKP